MARVLSRSNRPIIIQEPQSGLDTFLTEIAKYASPEYQQQKKMNERADARFELEEKRQQQNEQRYSDSLAQQDIINARNKTKAEQETKIFEDNQETNKRNNVNTYLGNQLDGLSPSDIVNLNKDSILAGLTDPFERQIASKVFDNTMNKSKSAVKIIDTRYKNFMEKNPDSNLSRIEAESVFSDEKVYKDYIVESYLVKKPDLTQRELKRLDFYSKRQVSLEKNLLKYQEMEQAGTGDQTDNISNIQENIDLNNLNIENILKLNQNTGTSSTDPYAKTTALSPFSDEYLGDVSRLYAGNEPSYDILFRQDSDDINIAEPALQLATENASQNNDIVYSDRLDESAPPATEEGGLDLVESREDGEKLNVPRDILDSLFPPGLKANQEEEKISSDVRERVGSNKKEVTSFNKQIPTSRRMRNPNIGSKDLREKIKDIKKDLRFVSNDPKKRAPNEQTRKNIQEKLPNKINNLKELFLNIYDENTGGFYNPNNPSHGLYEDRLNADELEFLKGL
jgi:hypothetical protein